MVAWLPMGTLWGFQDNMLGQPTEMLKSSDLLQVIVVHG